MARFLLLKFEPAPATRAPAQVEWTDNAEPHADKGHGDGAMPTRKAASSRKRGAEHHAPH